MNIVATKNPAAWCAGASAWNPGLTKLTPQGLGSGRAQQSARKIHAMLPANNPYSQADHDTLSVEVVWVDKQKAKLLRETAEFEWQRTISLRNVERLAGEMRRGLFIVGTTIFMAVLPDGSLRMLNGNHTMEAIIATDIAIPLTFVYRRVADIKAAGAIYAVLDIQKIRTWRDSLQATGKEDFPLATKVMPALVIIMSDFTYRTDAVEINSSRTLRFERMEEYRTAAGLMQNALAGAPGANVRIIQRAAIFAVALETMRYQPSTAHEFWRGMAQDDGLAKDDPRKALLRYGMNNIVRSGSANTIMARAASLAWNAYFRRTKLEYCKPNAALDFRLLGTPWSGGKAPSLLETGVQTTPTGPKPVSRFRGAA